MLAKQDALGGVHHGEVVALQTVGARTKLVKGADGLVCVEEHA